MSIQKIAYKITKDTDVSPSVAKDSFFVTQHEFREPVAVNTSSHTTFVLVSQPS